MNADTLIDAIGMVENRFLTNTAQPPAMRPLKKAMILIAAIMAVVLCFGTAMAVSQDFRGLVFAIFQIETPETPPAVTTEPTPETTDNTSESVDSGLQQIDIVVIDDTVQARYFSSDGLVLVYDGGFYTCSHVADHNNPPTDAAFWEIREESIANIGATRADFVLEYAGRSIPITLDYALLHGELNITVWPKDLDKDPVGNGWNAEPIEGRTDTALLSIPVNTGTDYTHDYLLLDLESMETTPLITSSKWDNMVIDACWITDDLRYGLLKGIDLTQNTSQEWLYDLESGTLTTMDALTGTNAAEAYFLDAETIAYQELLGEGRINLIRMDIPTGTQEAVLSDVPRRTGNGTGFRGIQKSGGYGAHCLLFCEDGSIDLINIGSSEILKISGLDLQKITTSESPDGQQIWIAYEETDENGALGNGFSKIGILDPENGVLRMLTRNVSGHSESFRGWVNADSVVITAHDTRGGYYVYVYNFLS